MYLKKAEILVEKASFMQQWRQLQPSSTNIHKLLIHVIYHIINYLRKGPIGCTMFSFQSYDSKCKHCFVCGLSCC